MFTGLVQAVGRVERAETVPTGRRLVIDLGEWSHRPAPGDSIAIDGCCLTVAGEPEGALAAFDAVPETLAKTTLGGLSVGSRVHLEHAVTGATLMGGHFVQGHIDGVARVDQIQRGADWRVRLRPPADLMRFMIPKGSVALAGVSLTLAEVSPEGGWIEVALIPMTLERTTLGDLAPGDPVNVEADMLVKAVVHTTAHYAGAVAGAVRGA